MSYRSWMHWVALPSWILRRISWIILLPSTIIFERGSINDCYDVLDSLERDEMLSQIVMNIEVYRNVFLVE